jgi:hypothetical protein
MAKLYEGCMRLHYKCMVVFNERKPFFGRQMKGKKDEDF